MPTMNPEQKLMEGSKLVIGILMRQIYRHPLFFPHFIETTQI